jgi:hypothetical protein
MCKVLGLILSTSEKQNNKSYVKGLNANTLGEATKYPK